MVNDFTIPEKLAEDATASRPASEGTGVSAESNVGEEVGKASTRRLTRSDAPCAPVVYLLKAVNSRRTYIGATIDLAHRVRQHNCEIQGGARRTALGGPWVVILHVEGFRTWREALQFEYAWRRVGKQVRRWDVKGRRDALALLQARERWSSRSPLASDVPLTCTEHHALL